MLLLHDDAQPCSPRPTRRRLPTAATWDSFNPPATIDLVRAEVSAHARSFTAFHVQWRRRYAVTPLIHESLEVYACRNRCYDRKSSRAMRSVARGALLANFPAVCRCDFRSPTEPAPGLIMRQHSQVPSARRPRPLPYRAALKGSSQVSCALLPALGKQNTTFSFNFTQPGKSLLVQPCTR